MGMSNAEVSRKVTEKMKKMKPEDLNARINKSKNTDVSEAFFNLFQFSKAGKD